MRSRMARYWKFVCLFVWRVYRLRQSLKVKKKIKETTKTNTKQKNESNTSWRNNTDNYSPRWEGLFVEVREVVETAVGITAGSDDDTSVKKLFPVVWVLYFLFPHCYSLAQFMGACQNWYQ